MIEELSIVIPLFNEWECVPSLVRELGRTGNELPFLRRYEIIFVDDGSTDGTGLSLEQSIRFYPEMRMIRRPSRGGQTAALFEGIRSARYSYIATMDGDLQNSLQDLSRVAQVVPVPFGLAYGVRGKKRETLAKAIASFLGNWVFRTWSGVPLQDTGSPIRVFSRDCFSGVSEWNGLHRLLPLIAYKNGVPVNSIPVSHRSREFGRSKYGIWDRIVPVLRSLWAISSVNGFKAGHDLA